MERIKGKYDDLINKARPGSTWVSGFTTPGNNDDLRAIDADGALMHFEPVSRYYASCKIKRGQAVSIAQLSDLSEKQKKNKYAYVKITDPDLDETCLGIAMNYAEEGQIIHVQRSGRFNYHTTKSILNTPKRREREIFLNADGWNFDEVRGQRLFIKKLYNNTTDAEQDDLLRKSSTLDGIAQDENGDAFDTDHIDQDHAADTESWFTYDFIDSIYNVKNTIQIGYLTDAPTTTTTPLTLKNGEFFDIDANKINAVIVALDTDGETLVVVDTSGKPITQTVEVIDKTTGQVAVDTNGKVITETRRVPVPKNNEAVWIIRDNTSGVRYYPADDQTVTVELEVTGDTRGPIDNTQFIVTLGETIYFDSKKQDVELKEPHYYQGIYDELKVLAIAQGNPRCPSFRVFNTTETDIVDNPLKQGFIALRKIDGDTYIIPVLSKMTTDDFNALIDANDEGYYKLSKQFSAGVERDYIIGYTSTNKPIIETRSPKITIGEVIQELNRDELKKAVTTGLKEIFVDEETLERGCTPKTYNIGDNGFMITTDKVGGYYDIYVSSELLGFVSATQVEHGQAAPAGTAILADIREIERLNVVGVVLSNSTGVHKKGETVKVMKMGRIVTLGNLQPGVTYYLGLNGRITAREQFWYDHCLPIGVAESSNYFLVDISQLPLHSYSGNFPLGYMKPSILGQAEKGFALMDGVTLYSKEQYPEIYELLLNWFDEEELKPSNVTEDDFNRLKSLVASSAFEDLLNKLQSVNLNLAQFQTQYGVKMTELEETTVQQNRRLSDIELVNSRQNTAIENAEESEQITELQNKLNTTEATVESMSNTISTLNSTISNLQGVVTNLQTQVKKLTEAKD